MRRASPIGGRIRIVVVLAAAALAAAAVVASARAAPIKGATFVSGTWFSPPSFLFFTTAGGDPADGLTGLGCPFIPEPAPTEAQTSRLTYAYNGWIGPIQDPDSNPNQQVLLRTHVAGTVEDAAGSRWMVLPPLEHPLRAFELRLQDSPLTRDHACGVEGLQVLGGVRV